MEIERFINPIAQENTYLLKGETSCIVIDPGSDPKAVIDAISSSGLVLIAILLSHAHFDHIMGLSALKQHFPDALIYLHEAEKTWPKAPEYNASRLLLGKDVLAPDADCFYKIGLSLDLGEFHFKVLETPGHSIGGVSLVFDTSQLVFTGDALFYEAIGRWDLPTGNYEQLRHSIEAQLFTLPEHYQIFPGHGSSSSIGHEIHFNPFFRR